MAIENVAIEETKKEPKLQEPLEPIPRKQVREILGAGPRGASHGRTAVTYDGMEYHAKGLNFDSSNPKGPVNELIVAQLLDSLGVPVPPYVVLEIGDGLSFGSEFLRRKLAVRFTPEIFERTRNKEAGYQMVVCDVWLCNVDRHGGNISAERVDQSQDDADAQYRLWAIDHERTLLQPGQTTQHFQLQDQIPLNRLVKALRDCITDWQTLETSIRSVEQISDPSIESAVHNVPNSLLDSQEKEEYVTFIKQRRTRVRAIIEAGLSTFPKLRWPGG